MKPSRPDARTYRRLLAYVRPYWPTFAVAAAMSVIAATAAAAYAYLVGPLLAALLGGKDAPVGGMLRFAGGDLTRTVPLLILAAAVVKGIAQWLHGGLTTTLGQRVMADLRRDLHGHLLELPPRFFETRHSGELLSRFTSDVAQVEFAVGQALGSYVKDSLQILALLAVCFVLDPWLFLLAFVVLPAAIYPVSRFARSVRKVAVRTQASLGQLTELSSEVLHNVAAVQAYRMEPALLQRFDAEQGRYLGAMRRSLFLRGAFTPTVELIGILGAALAIGAGARAVFADPSLAPKLLSFIGAALLLYQPLKALSGTYSMVVQGLGAAERLFEIQDAPRAPDAGEDAGPLRTALRFEDVTVSYDDTRTALDRLTLEIPAGKRVALVGASGAGKTTVFSAVLGFIAPRGGQVTWDGTPLAALRRSSVRAQLAWVPQEAVLFSGTVRENLRLGRPDATDAELWEALSHAHADGFVRALPAGLDEPVGERGGSLSGGQRQRLAIARAFLRKPSLLLLDEPTSALDAESERAVQAGLSELMAGRTTLVIAHRLSTVRDADRIYVLGDGRVLEWGTHAELWERRGAYAALLQRGELVEAEAPPASA